MTTIDQAKDAIYNQLTTEWAAASRTEPIAKENDAANHGTAEFNSSYGPWLRILVQENAGGQVALGAVGDRPFERRGQIMVQCFVVADTGTELLDTLLQTVRDSLEGLSFSGVTTFEAVSRPLDESQNDGRWYGKIMDIEFRYKETK